MLQIKSAVLLLFLISVCTGTTGCIDTQKSFNPYKLANPLNNFSATSNSFQKQEKDKDRLFSRYARECAYGIDTQADKLAELFSSTLDPKSPNYLYFQQESFATEYRLCRLAMKSCAEGESPTETCINASAKLDKILPIQPDILLKMIQTFIANGDTPSAMRWFRILSVVEKSDIKAESLLGDYLFSIDGLEDMGYKIIFTSAAAGSHEAMNLLEEHHYAEYRKNHPQEIKKFLNLIHKKNDEDGWDSTEETTSDIEEKPDTGFSQSKTDEDEDETETDETDKIDETDKKDNDSLKPNNLKNMNY